MDDKKLREAAAKYEEKPTAEHLKAVQREAMVLINLHADQAGNVQELLEKLLPL